MLEQHGAVLEARKYVPANVKDTLESEKHDHLDKSQKEKLAKAIKNMRSFSKESEASGEEWMSP